MGTAFEQILRPTSPTNPRNGEGSMIELQDGSLFLAFGEFYSTNAGDYGAAHICGMRSRDRGRNWTPSFPLVENDVLTTFSASLLRLHSGKILMAYCRKHSRTQGRFWMQASSDEAQTWSVPWPSTPAEGYFVMNNDRLVQLSTGRILQPVAIIPPDVTEDDPFHCITTALYSDDEGLTWAPSRTLLDVPAIDGLQEPGIVELKDGSLMMYYRTSLGCQYCSWSTDQGESWSLPEAMDGLVSPVSPASIKRIPQTGDLLAIYNHQPPNLDRPRRYRGRFPLTAAISQDEGQTWQLQRNVETNAAYEYDYTSITFVEDEVLLTYHQVQVFGGGEGQYYRNLKLKILPVAWFYN